MPRCCWIALLGWAVCGFAESGGYELNVEWQRHLGRAARNAVYRYAVCPDGTFYLSDGNGGIAALNALGQPIAARRGMAEAVQALALACDAEGRLYVAGPAGLSFLDRTPAGDFAKAGTVKPPVRIERMAAARGGLIYAAGVRPGSRLPLHALSASGSLLRSFGEEPSRFFVLRGPPEIFLVWEDARSRLLAIPRNPFEIQVYASDGAQIEVRTPESLSGEVTGAAGLPSGGLVVQEQNHPPRRPAISLDVYSPDFRLIAGGIAAAHGLLAGVAQDGSLYFADNFAGNVRITRARLSAPLLAMNSGATR